ncbi:MAG: hypothetical protein AAF652_21950 [Cyanobacteria bacterium P01_C01_bin.72]
MVDSRKFSSTKETVGLVGGDSGCNWSKIQFMTPERKGRAKQKTRAIATQRKIAGRLLPLVGYPQLRQISVPSALSVPQT